VKKLLVNPIVRSTIREFSKEARKELGSALLKLQLGEGLGMPISRPMPMVANGVHEMRIRDSAGIYRVFYCLKTTDAILVFHAFTKKTQETPRSEIELGRKRLREMLNYG